MSSSHHDNLLGTGEDRLHVRSRSPGTVDGSDSVHVPAQAPTLVGGVMSDKRWPGRKPVLRSYAAHCDVQRMVRKQNLSAVQERLEVEALTTAFETRTFLTEISSQLGFILTPQW